MSTMPPPPEGIPMDYATPPGPRRTGMAIAAMVLGILGLFLCMPLGLVGLILGIVAVVRSSSQPSVYGGKGMAIAGICTGGASLIIFPMMIAIMLPSLSRARELAKRAVCRANMRGIGQGCHIYANDNDNWFPPDLQTLVTDGVATPGQFVCPSSGSVAGDPPDYTYIPGLDDDAPLDWIIMYEDPANHGGEGGCVLYVDGTVEFLKEPMYSQELQRVRQAIEDSEYGERPWYRAHNW